MESIDWDIYAKSYEDTQHLVGRPDLAQRHYELIGKEQGRDPHFDPVLVYCLYPEVDDVHASKAFVIGQTFGSVIRSKEDLIRAIRADETIRPFLPSDDEYLVVPSVDSAVFQLHLEQVKCDKQLLMDQIVQYIMNELVSDVGQLNSPGKSLVETPGTQIVGQRPGVIKLKHRAPCIIGVDVIASVLEGAAYLVVGYCFDPEDQLQKLLLNTPTQRVDILPVLRRVVRNDRSEELLSRGAIPQQLEQDVGFAALIPSALINGEPSSLICEFAAEEVRCLEPQVKELKALDPELRGRVWVSLHEDFFDVSEGNLDVIDPTLLSGMRSEVKSLGYFFDLEVQQIAVVERSVLLRLNMADPESQLKALYLKTPNGRYLRIDQMLVRSFSKIQSTEYQTPKQQEFDTYLAFLEGLFLAQETQVELIALLNQGEWISWEAKVKSLLVDRTRELILAAWNPKNREHSRQVLELLVEPAYDLIFSASRANKPIRHQEIQIGPELGFPRASILINLRQGQNGLRGLLAAIATDVTLHDVEILMLVDRAQAIVELEQILTDWFPVYRVPVKIIGTNELSSSSSLFNLAATIAKGKWLLFLDGQILPTRPGWIELFLQQLESDVKVGMVGAQIMNPDESINQIGFSFQRDPLNSDLWIHESPWQGFSLDLLSLSVPFEMPAVSVQCAATSKSLFLGIDGFDESHALDGFEEIDLSMKLWSAGRRIVVLPNTGLIRLNSEYEADEMDSDRKLKLKLANSKRQNSQWAHLIDEHFSSWTPGKSFFPRKDLLIDTIQKVVGL